MRRDCAVVEILDTVLLLAVGIAVFAVIALSLLPLPVPATPPKVSLSAYIRGNYVFIEHMGGDALNFSSVEISVHIGGEAMPKPSLHEINRNGLWECGEFVRYPYSSNKTVSVLVVDRNNGFVLLHGNLKREEKIYIGAPPPILVSSLRTNSTDEDLICYAPPVKNFSPKTFIYSWRLNGEPFTEVLLPFDTDSSSSAKDYSGNGYNAVVNGATWVSNGKIGGCYLFDGVNDNIVVSNLPSIFEDTSRSNFTISFWIKCTNVSKGCLFEAYKNKSNFVRIFLDNGSINSVICKEGKKIWVKSGCSIINDTWYYIAVTWKLSKGSMEIYINSTNYTSLESGNVGNEGIKRLTIGSNSTGRNHFSGYIDDLIIYRRALSAVQISQNYMDSKDGFTDHRTIVADETRLGEVWSCKIFPNDGKEDGEVIESELLWISPYQGGG
ncbi:MAG: type IV pilin [Thermoplasmata archaeon]|nr:type IV pilin [Thermoplasmata archaeon]